MTVSSVNFFPCRDASQCHLVLTAIVSTYCCKSCGPASCPTPRVPTCRVCYSTSCLMLRDGVLLVGNRLGLYGSNISLLYFHSVAHDGCHVYIPFDVLCNTLRKDPHPNFHTVSNASMSTCPTSRQSENLQEKTWSRWDWCCLQIFRKGDVLFKRLFGPVLRSEIQTIIRHLTLQG